nr:hypothetical protein [Sorangium cellulosum]
MVVAMPGRLQVIQREHRGPRGEERQRPLPQIRPRGDAEHVCQRRGGGLRVGCGVEPHEETPLPEAGHDLGAVQDRQADGALADARRPGEQRASGRLATERRGERVHRGVPADAQLRRGQPRCKGAPSSGGHAPRHHAVHHATQAARDLGPGLVPIRSTADRSVLGQWDELSEFCPVPGAISDEHGHDLDLAGGAAGERQRSLLVHVAIRADEVWAHQQHHDLGRLELRARLRRRLSSSLDLPAVPDLDQPLS